MRKALIFAFATTLAWASFSQPAAAPKPTRGDGLVDKLKAAVPALKAAFQEASQKAEAGDAAAAESVSRWLVYGQGAAVDLKAAFIWAKKGAEAGRGTAQLHLGLLYRHGNGVEPDENASNVWFAKAAKSLPAQVEAKDTDAMLALATLHYRGWGGLEQDRAAALKLNQQAADAGSPFGLVEVADMLWDGKGTHRQRSKAKKLYLEALPKLMTLGETGSVRAQFIVGNMLAAKRMSNVRQFEESIKWQQPSADGGYAAAEFIIGARHQKGHGTPQNDAVAMQWYTKAAAQGHPGGINNVGWMHGNGRAGGAQDGAKAAAEYLRAAQRGNAVSQNNIALRMFYGQDVAADKEKAYEWHKRSAENDNGRGQYYLALRYETGEGVAADLERAIYWYTRAGNNDSVYAQKKLMELYRDGRGVKRDLGEAMNWAARVTEYVRDETNPFRAAEANLAREARDLYERLRQSINEGWPLDLQDYDQALEAKAEGGNAEAQYAMAALYAVGLGGVSRDEKRAFGYATKAAAQDHARAQYFVAICTEEGRHTKRDAAKARALYEKAAAAGHLGALNNLAVLQEEEGDEKAALAGYTKAAESLANAQYNLGRLIEAGKAEGDAAALYRKAALQGHPAAQNNLGVMHQTGKGAEKDLEEAERWFRYAANQGHLEAMFNLGQFTARGQGGLQVDRVQAFEWWGRMALTGHEAATTQLAALANGMTEAEKTQGRARVEMWRNNNEVNQYFVIRKGD